MREHTVARDGEPDLFVVETGPTDARPILFVHGYSQSHLSWRDQLDSTLADDYRLVAVDLRGHGDSAKPRNAYGDGDYWASDVAALVDALELDDLVLVGWSYGSLVALDYLARGTERVAGAVLVGVVAGIGTETTNEWLGEEYLALFPELVSTDAEESAAALSAFVDLCYRESPPADQRYLDLGFNTVVPPYVRDGMRDREVSHLDLLDELDVPTLLVHGVHDAVVSVEAGRAVADRLPDGQLVEYPESGHTPFRENPERFEADLREFVGALSD